MSNASVTSGTLSSQMDVLEAEGRCDSPQQGEAMEAPPMPPWPVFLAPQAVKLEAVVANEGPGRCPQHEPALEHDNFDTGLDGQPASFFQEPPPSAKGRTKLTTSARPFEPLDSFAPGPAFELGAWSMFEQAYMASAYMRAEAERSMKRERAARRAAKLALYWNATGGPLSRPVGLVQEASSEMVLFQ